MKRKTRKEIIKQINKLKEQIGIAKKNIELCPNTKLSMERFIKTREEAISILEKELV